MHKNLPKIKELRKLFLALKKDIRDDYRCSLDYAPGGDDSGPPSMDVLIYWGPEYGWGYHTGAVDYFDGDGNRPYQAVVYLDRRSNSTELALDVREQLQELACHIH